MHRLLYLGTAARGAVCIVCQGAQWSAPAPLIFSFSSHKEEKEKLPHKKRGAREVRIPSLRPATSTFPPFRRGRGA